MESDDALAAEEAFSSPANSALLESGELGVGHLKRAATTPTKPVEDLKGMSGMADDTEKTSAEMNPDGERERSLNEVSTPRTARSQKPRESTEPISLLTGRDASAGHEGPPRRRRQGTAHDNQQTARPVQRQRRDLR